MTRAMAHVVGAGPRACPKSACMRTKGSHRGLPLRAAMNTRAILGICAALLLTGCATKQESVRVAVPVPCRVQVPPRPEMPTENLPVDAALDDFVAAAAAEIERREGYELQLRAALEACAPSTFSPPALAPP